MGPSACSSAGSGALGWDALSQGQLGRTVTQIHSCPRVPLSQGLRDAANNPFPPQPPLPALTERLSTWHTGGLRKHQ